MSTEQNSIEAAIAASQPSYVQGCDDLRARTDSERSAYLEGLEEGKRIAALSAQPDAVGGGDVRAQFEAWAKGQGYSVEWKHEGYVQRSSQIAYHAWQAAIADRQPVGEPLWCMHILGPDDVHAAPSKAHAEKAAAALNAFHAARAGQSEHDPKVGAVVAPWPHSAESHAESVSDFIPDWLLPRWQVEAIQTNTAPPAPAAVPVQADAMAIADEIFSALCVAGEYSGWFLDGEKSEYTRKHQELQWLLATHPQQPAPAAVPVDGEGWSGWATQYPGKAPVLRGAREIAELNYYPEEGQRLLFLTSDTHPQPAVAKEHAHWPQIKLWFFRELNSAQREKLFTLCGVGCDGESMANHSAETMVLRAIIDQQAKSAAAKGGE